MEASRRSLLLGGTALGAVTIAGQAMPALAGEKAGSSATSATTSARRMQHHGPAGWHSVDAFHGLDHHERRELLRIARDTWRFFEDDIDPVTHLPYDNVTYAGGSKKPTSYGRYTSSANIGVYMWSIVAARDLGVIREGEALSRARQLLHSVKKLDRAHGFLYQWYNTTTGNVLMNPGQPDVLKPGGTLDNGSFLSCVDNGWYVSGLVVLRNAMPQLRHLVAELMADVDFSIFYDNRPQTHCNANPAVTGNQPTGQMFGGYYVGMPPTEGDNWHHYYHSGALYSDPRISAYLGMGLGQMPGDVWWRSWRMLPPAAPFSDCKTTDPDFSWQGQWPLDQKWVMITDPISGKQFPVFESHYTYPGTNLKFIPTWGGGMFEALMANCIVPETSWGTHSLGLANHRTLEVHRKYTAEQLKLPVWGMSPCSTPDDTGGYATYAVTGEKFPYFGASATTEHPNLGLSQQHGGATEDVVTPHASFIALDVDPRAAMKNIDTLLARFPDVYGSRGFFDALNPTTRSVGHRILVLDQSMLLTSIANALCNRSMQRYFAADRVSWAAHRVLTFEHMSL